MIGQLKNIRFGELKAEFIKYTLEFKQPSGTSRGVMTEKDSWFIKVYEADNPDIVGIGECGPLRGLSYDDFDDLNYKLSQVCEKINNYPFLLQLGLGEFPAVKFALETALLDLLNKGEKLLFPSKFTEGKDFIPINGLIWMGDMESMLKQVESKLEQGFACVKMKIGAIDLAQELNILKSIREQFSADQVELRVDANGAFAKEEALEKLKQLSEYQLHSIEQPIRANQYDAMAMLCERSPLPIALDEDLIGIFGIAERKKFLKILKPQYIVLKPSLLGGFAESLEWIEAANELDVGWWITSALESNIGLNAIAQWTYTLENKLPQGLGTGQLYTNNFASPLKLEADHLYFDPTAEWNLEGLD